MFCCKNKDDGASPVKKSKKAVPAKVELKEEGFKMIPVDSKASEPEGEPPKAMVPAPAEGQIDETITKVDNEEVNEPVTDAIFIKDEL